jgi:GTP-binding protein
LRIRSYRFDRAATSAAGEPRTPLPHVVLLGRSNVGKSLLLNALLGARGLARVSSRPGRTQAVQFYCVNERWYLVDLPGYGYAEVPEALRRSWAPMVEGYLERNRERIALALLVVDGRHPPSDLDRTARAGLEARGVGHVVAATKADRMGAAERARQARRLEAEFSGVPVLWVSGRTELGLRGLWACLDAALAGGSRAGPRVGARG